MMIKGGDFLSIIFFELKVFLAGFFGQRFFGHFCVIITFLSAVTKEKALLSIYAQQKVEKTFKAQQIPLSAIK